MIAFSIILDVILLMWALFAIKRGALMSSRNKWWHAIGSGIKHKHFVMLLLITGFCSLAYANVLNQANLWKFLVLCLFSVMVFSVANSLKKILMQDERCQKDAFNFVLQTLMLLSVGVLIIGSVVVFDINSDNFVAFGILATILGWIFQDVIKGVVAYYHLHFNGLLHIGDWVEIPKYNIEGEVKDISLVTVTVMGMNNSLSSVPTAEIQADHLRNLQDVFNGKTSGKMVDESFHIDYESVHTVDKDELLAICNKLKKEGSDIIALEHVDTPVLNVHLLRMYLRHWLMNHPKVSRKPWLIVSLLDPTEMGIPLVIKTYLTDVTFQEFEMSRSLLNEYILTMIEIFGLKVYQYRD